MTASNVSKTQVANGDFGGSFEALKAVLWVSGVNEWLSGVMGTADNQKGKLITEHSCFRSVLHCAPLPVLIDKLHNSL